MLINAKGDSFTLKSQWDLEIWLKTEMLNFKNKGVDW